MKLKEGRKNKKGSNSRRKIYKNYFGGNFFLIFYFFLGNIDEIDHDDYDQEDQEVQKIIN